MMSHEKNDTFASVAERLERNQLARAIGHIGVTTMSYALPLPERPYRELRSTWEADHTTELQPTITETLRTNQPLLDAYTPQNTTDTLSSDQLSWFVSAMYQFSDRNGLADAMQTPHETIDSLHQDIIDQGATHPTTFSEQLALSLDRSPTIPSAIWNLFLTSRQYARWRDSEAIDGASAISGDERLALMKEWEQSVAAIKQPDKHGYQDAAGDTYYTWTHALAKIIYQYLPEKNTPLTRGYSRAFHMGSYLMSSSHLIGKFSNIGTMSNHIPASRYGNAIGDQLVEHLRTTQPTE